MIKRDTTPLSKFLAKVKDASKLGLKEVRLDTKDAVEISTLLAQMLLDQHSTQKEPNIVVKSNFQSTDGGLFKP